MAPDRLVGQVRVSPREPKPGESVLVEVLAVDGERGDEAAGTTVRINGVSGARQYLQFPRGGLHHLHIVVDRAGRAEHAKVDVQVKSPASTVLERHRAAAEAAGPEQAALRPAPKGLGVAERKALLKARVALPLLQVGKRADAPYGAAFSVGGVRAFPADRADTRTFTKKVLEPELERHRASAVPTGEAAASEVGRRWITTRGGRSRSLPMDAKLLRRRGLVQGALELCDQTAARPTHDDDAPNGIRYHWDFGDGTTALTHGPRVDHDYAKEMDGRTERRSFDVSLTVEAPGAESILVKRTLSVVDGYVLCKKRHFLVPPVEPQTFATTEGLAFRGSMKVRNPERFTMVLRTRRLRAHTPRPDGAEAPGPVTAIDPIRIPPKSECEITVLAPFREVPRRSTGFSAYYFGEAPDGTPIRVEGTFTIRAKDRASDAMTVGDVSVARLPMVRAVASAAIALDAARVAGAAAPTVVSPPLDELPALSPSQPSAPSLVEGEECDPEALPELTAARAAEGWACQATTETREVVTPARFLNALRGDIVLSAGGNGIIGRLLLQVSPPQRYSHSAIMTRDHDELTHSIASVDRLLDHGRGGVLGKPAPTDGFEPEALKYMWPGVVKQTVDEAVFGEDMVDPETNHPYRVTGFTPVTQGSDIAGHWEIVPPLVVKPDPMLETPEIRQRLHRVAADAAAQSGQSHYRLYCYTDPAIGQSSSAAPATAGWAAGTYPTVCSSFLWLTLKRQGVALESAGDVAEPSDLEPEDVQSGAEVGPHTPDGLYRYTSEERARAFEWLRGQLALKVAERLEEAAGPLAGAVAATTDMANDVANQMLNTFAFDDADVSAKDSDAWRDPGTAHAVSPTDILHWDGPEALGLYGFTAPLQFRPARLEEVVVHRWRKVQTRGAIAGTVSSKDVPVEGAVVQAYDGKTTFTDSVGGYRLADVPVGRYLVRAHADTGAAGPATATVEFTVQAGENRLDIGLLSPEDAYRKVVLRVRIQTTDDETWPLSDQTECTQHYAEKFVQPWQSHEWVSFVQELGDELRIEVTFVLDLNMDRSVTTTVNARMYEGTTSKSHDLDDEENMTGFVVGKDQERSGYIRLYNEGAFGGDVSNIEFTIVNLAQR